MMQGSYPMVRAVAAPEVDAAVIFDFNEHGSWFSSDTLRDGWSLGSPTRLAAAGDARTAWGPRRVEFSMRLRGSRAMAAQAQSALARWLLQPSGWLLFQLDAMTPPVWVRMVGAEPQDLDFGLIHATGERDIWDMGVAFDADPFLYGERATLFSGGVSNDPVTGGMVAKLGPAPGDAPMPLRVTLSHTGDGPMPPIPAWVGGMQLFTVAGDSSVAPVVVSVGTGDGATGVHSEVSVVSGSGYPGGSARRVGFSAAAAAVAMGDQFSVSIPSALPLGVYRVLANVQVANTSNTSYGLSARMSYAGMDSELPTVSLAPNGSVGGQRWIDLGEYSHPLGGVPAGAEGLPLPPALTTVTVRASRASTAGALTIGALLFVPLSRPAAAPSRTLRIGGTGTGYTFRNDTFDAATETTWVATSDGARFVSARSCLGGWPAAVPGDETTLLLVKSPAASTQFGGTFDYANRGTSVTVTGHPQWLYLPTL